jgi:hypothetical protein
MFILESECDSKFDLHLQVSLAGIQIQMINGLIYVTQEETDNCVTYEVTNRAKHQYRQLRKYFDRKDRSCLRFNWYNTITMLCTLLCKVNGCYKSHSCHRKSMVARKLLVALESQ